MITNLRYADNIILLATSEAELQELVDRLDRVSREYSLLIKVDETKVMASDGIAWTAKKTNEWVFNKAGKAGVKRQLLDPAKARKLAYYGHTILKQGSCLKKEIMAGTTPGARRRGRPRTALMDNIKTWTALRGRVNQNDRGQG